MSFEEWWKKNYGDGYEDCDFSITALKGAYEAGLHADVHTDNSKVIAELEAQIEKLIDFVLSKTECCDVCPITDTCINSEGTCPYAGILAKGEEEVTREWLMQIISRR
jgi:hypothetical protein